MKCQEPPSNRTAKVQLYANGVPCPEYALLPLPGAQSHIVRCCVPVQENKQITIKCRFNGDTFCGSIDLLIGGVLRNEARFGDQQVGKDLPPCKFWSKPIDFDHAVAKRDKTLESRTILTRPQPPTAATSTASTVDSSSSVPLKVGDSACVSVVFAMCLSKEETAKHVHGYSTVEDRVHLALPVPRLGLPTTTHEIVLLPKLDALGQRQQLPAYWQARSKARSGNSLVSGLRFGNKPWARFDFHLRSESACIWIFGSRLSS